MPVRGSFATLLLAAVVTGAMIMAPLAEACTRLVYHGADGQIITARSMDWRS